MPHALQHMRPALATLQTRVLVTPQLAHICRQDIPARSLMQCCYSANSIGCHPAAEDRLCCLALSTCHSCWLQRMLRCLHCGVCAAGGPCNCSMMLTRRLLLVGMPACLPLGSAQTLCGASGLPEAASSAATCCSWSASVRHVWCASLSCRHGSAQQIFGHTSLELIQHGCIGYEQLCTNTFWHAVRT